MSTEQRAFLVGVALCADPFGQSRRLISRVTMRAATIQDLRHLQRLIALGTASAFLIAVLGFVVGAVLILNNHDWGVALAVVPLVTLHATWHYLLRH